MFSYLFDDGYAPGRYYYDDGFGLNRRGWADKSEAASRREGIANSKFDAYLEKCSALDANDKSLFPITEEVVDASVHLTDACWKTFRQRVEGKGCKAKRREATLQERVASGDKRKGKLYVISITCPVHPKALLEAKAKKEAAAVEKKKKAEEAAVRKAEKERKDREEKARLASLHREAVSERYASIVGQDGSDNNEHKTPGKKSGTMDAFVQVKVTTADLLQHAASVHSKQQTDLRIANQTEERKLMSELMKKHEQEKQELRKQMKSKEEKLLADAKMAYEDVKGKIEACSDDKEGHKTSFSKTATTNFVTPSISAKKQRTK